MTAVAMQLHYSLYHLQLSGFASAQSLSLYDLCLSNRVSRPFVASVPALSQPVVAVVHHQALSFSSFYVCRLTKFHLVLVVVCVEGNLLKLILQ